MGKKLISVWLSFVLLLVSGISIYAGQSSYAQFLNRNIYINGVQFQNYHLTNPFVLYDNVTYIPLNTEMSQILGFTAKMDWESRTLELVKTKPAKTKPDSSALKSNLQNVPVSEAKNVTAVVRAGKEKSKVTFSTYSLLKAGNTLYLPVRALTGNSCFGWTAYYDDYSGVYLSTSPSVSAYSFFDRKESDLNRGLTQYILQKNGNLAKAYALNLVFIFKHEADVSKQSATLLMAMAEKESTFRADAVGGGGSTGLLQIKVSTAKGYGYTAADLKDPHKNVELGAKILSRNAATFGTTEKALAVYNQGAGAVSRGQMRNGYYSRVLDAQANLNSYLAKNGYGTGK